MLVVSLSLGLTPGVLAADWLVYEGTNGPGHGKRIVFVSGDEEYRSEEGLPMLARVLAFRHGFKCTVLFAIDPSDGTINPTILTNIPGMAALDQADLCVLGLRFRELPDSQMKHFVDYLEAGKPVVALRTSTHAFQYQRRKDSPYARYDWRDKDWPGGFGQQVLGETWVAHHGEHGRESSRGIVNDAAKADPLLRGVSDVWVPTDVYEVVHLPRDAKVLLWGQVLAGMKPTDSPVPGAKNEPLMPVAWIRNYAWRTGKTSKVFATTMGAAVDLRSKELGAEAEEASQVMADYLGQLKALSLYQSRLDSLNLTAAYGAKAGTSTQKRNVV